MSRDNNLNFLRLFFASLVLVSHSFSICFLPEPIVGNGYGIGSVGTLGVYGFFTVSGYLMIHSYNRYDHIGIFLWHRFLRIYPALIIVVFFSALLMFFTQEQIGIIEYIKLDSFWKFIFGNATLINIGSNSIDYVLWGVNKYNVINGPLWTLPVEVRMYLFVAMLGSLGLLKDKTYFNLFLIILLFLDYKVIYEFILYKVQEPSFMQSMTPVLYFMMGMFFALNKMKSNILLFLGALLISIVSVMKVLPLTLQVIAISYSIYYIAFNFNIFRNFFNKKIGDYSYGVYIYTFPIQQFTYYIAKKHFMINLNVIELIMVSLIFIIPLSIFSWHFLESRILKFKNIFEKKNGEVKCVA
jgi:peptidoglycan/LPS O-acetylase OafA/YrhL